MRTVNDEWWVGTIAQRLASIFDALATAPPRTLLLDGLLDRLLRLTADVAYTRTARRSPRSGTSAASRG